MEKQYTVTLTERQIRDLETYALSQELNSSHRSNIEFYNALFLTLNNARLEKQELLKVLRELVEQIDEDMPEENMTRHFIDTLDDARYLIKKATGQEI